MPETYLGEIKLTDETLAHYGVMGMKWGHRKSQVTSSAAYNRILTMSEDEYQKLLKGVKLVTGKGKSSSSASKSSSGSSSSSSGSSSKSSGSSSSSSSSSSNAAKKAVDDLLTKATNGNTTTPKDNASNSSDDRLRDEDDQYDYYDDYKVQISKEWSDLLDDYITRKNNASQLDNVTFRKKHTKLKKRS